MPSANYPIDNVQELQRTLCRAAKRDATRRFHALFDKVYRKDILQKAWEMVKKNGGVCGTDGQTIKDIEKKGVNAFLHTLGEDLREGRYHPAPVKRVYIPKPNGQKRPLGIPSVRDRIAQAAVKIVIEPIFEADFRPCSFGFRPKRSAHMAIEVIRQTANRGYNLSLIHI